MNNKKLIENQDFRKYSLYYQELKRNQDIPETKVPIEVEIFYQENKVNTVTEDNEFIHQNLSNVDSSENDHKKIIGLDLIKKSAIFIVDLQKLTGTFIEKELKKAKNG